MREYRVQSISHTDLRAIQFVSIIFELPSTLLFLVLYTILWGMKFEQDLTDTSQEFDFVVVKWISIEHLMVLNG